MGNSLFLKLLFISILILVVFLGIEFWSQMPLYWLKLNKLQRDIVDCLSEYLVLISQGKIQYGWFLSGFSFLYGLLHSISPGHGKTAITSVSVINNYRPTRAIKLVITIALLQASSACLLFWVAAILTQPFSLRLSDNVH